MSTYKASEQTKKQFSDALRKKMQTKLLNKISVRELAEECGLNRQTFYYHFNDIYDLLHWTFEQDAAKLVCGRVTAGTWQDDLRIVLRYIEENRELYLSALSSMQHHYLTQFLCKGMNPAVVDLVEKATENLKEADQFKQFLTHFYTTSIAALVVDWIDRMQKEVRISADDLIRMIDITLDGTMQMAVERYKREYPEK